MSDKPDEECPKVLLAAILPNLRKMSDATIFNAIPQMKNTNKIHIISMSFCEMREAGLIDSDGISPEPKCLILALEVEVSNRMENWSF